MRILLTVVTKDGLRDAVARGDDAMTIKHLSVALREEFRSPGRGLWAGGRRLPSTTPVSVLLKDGDAVGFDAAAPTTLHPEPVGVVEVRVSGGPAAGAVHRLGFGMATVGGGRWCTVPVTDALAPECFAEIVVEQQRVLVKAVAEGVTLDGEPFEVQGEPRTWPIGGVLMAGASVFTLMVPKAGDAHLTPMPGGTLAYNRPPRLGGRAQTHRVEVPAEPGRPEHQRLQLLSSLLFAVGGVVMAVVMKSPWFLLMTLLTPLTMVGQWWSDKRYGRKQHRQAVKEYRQRRAEVEAELERLRHVDQAERRAASPDPAEMRLIATGPRQRLWERRIHDADSLHLRVGLADQPANIELAPESGEAKELPSVPTCHAVPITVPLPQAGVMGVTGDRSASRGLLRWLVAQSAALHSPRDLAIVVLSASKQAGADWEWVRWLPHCAPREGEECVALVGNDPESAARRVAELVGRIGDRRSRQAGGFGGEPSFGAAAGNNVFAAGYATARPYNILVVLDGARALRELPGMAQVLQLGPTVGIYAVCVDDDQRLLPEECTTVAVCDRPGTVRLRGGNSTVGADIIADHVGAFWCDRLARAIAPVRDIGRDDADAMIPNSARLLSLLGMPDPSPQQIAAYWAGDRTTRVPIGIGVDGPYFIDLRLDGPHGLIAGTTGAGKSELLQSMIASLAVANRPDEMTFVLIDYKGGSAFKDCAKLPHTVGMVSDLDGHLTERALESLAAELKRREHMLLGADAKDIEDYNEIRDDEGAQSRLEPMPRLVLVIDEFAAMVAELPDFITGLVDIARRGRSLGVHLILATQRPGGVVTPDIAANTNLRIALRVTSTEESSDVINAADAAGISKTTPGRCYVRSGATSLHLVQSARIGGRRPGDGPARTQPVQVDPVDWRRLGMPLPKPPEVEDDSTMATDLTVLVEAIRQTTVAHGIDKQRSPWLPPLPETLTLAELDLPHAADVAPLPFGMADIPAGQRRQVETYDLATSGHLLVIGGGRSGRSTVLRAIAGSAGTLTDPRDVHLFGVDCGNNQLLPLVGMPHTGAVVGRDAPERLKRLTNRLLEEITRRQQLLAAQGFADLAEQRAAVPPEQRLPYLLVLFDRWEGFIATFDTYDNGTLIDKWMQVLQEGASAGIKVVMTGDRSTLIGAISTQFDDRLVLKLTDPADYAYVGMKPKDIPADLAPGRAFRSSTSLREVQVALLADDSTGTAQVAALHNIARTAKSRFEANGGHAALPRELRPIRVDALPNRIGLDEVIELAEAPLPTDAVVVGAGGDTLSTRYFRAEDHGPSLIIAGPPKTGRSTTLCTMLTYVLRQGWEAVVITPRRSPLRDFAGRPGVRGSFTTTADADEVKAAVSACGGRHVVFIDDLELVGSDSALSEWVTDHITQVRDTGNLVIAAGGADELDTMYAGPILSMKKTRSGMLLRPTQTSQGDLFGIPLPRSVATGTGPAGRGLFITSGTWEQIQVASPPASL